MYKSIKCKLVLIFTWVLLISITEHKKIVFCQKESDCIHLNDQIFSTWWDSFNKQLEQVQQIQVKTLILNQTNMIKLFNHSMLKLKNLDFFNHELGPRQQFQEYTALTPKIIQTIFQSKYFETLQVLDLQRVNLDYRSFQFLQKWDQNKKISLRNLTLNENYLQKKAFKYLQKLNFNGSLINFGLAMNSLIQIDSIDSLQKILKSKNGQKSSIVNITLFETSINGQNLIKILQCLNLQKLESLNIGNNALQHSKKFTIPFNNSIYQYITQQHFLALKKLSLTNLDLDETHIQYFQNWRLPSLQILILTENFLNDQFVDKWINRQHMPNLKQLHLNQNNITDIAVKHLIQQGFSFQYLRFDGNKQLTGDHIQYLQQMNTSRLNALTLSSQFATEQDWKKLFEIVNFQTIQKLYLMKIRKMTNFFNYINWKKMPNLKILHINNIDVSESFQTIFTQNMSFPNLQEILISGTWFSNDNLTRLLNYINIFSPKLKLAEFPLISCINVSSINIETLPDNMYIKVRCALIRKIANQNKLQAISIVFGNDFIFYNQNSTQCFNQLNPQITQQTCIGQFDTNLTIVKLFSDRISKLFQFKGIQKVLLISHEGILFFKQLFFGYITNSKIQKQFEEFQDSQGQTQFQTQVYLPYLKIIQYLYQGLRSNSYPVLSFFFTKVKSPELYEFSMQNQILTDVPYIYNFIMSKAKNIRTLQILNAQIICQTFQTVFKNIKFVYLKMLTLQGNYIQSKCLDQFLKKHQKIRGLQVSENFLEKNFFSALSNNDLILSSLGCQMIRFGDKQFAKFGKVNTQFLRGIDISSIGINSDGIISFLKTKEAFGNIYFPKLQVFLSNMNNIQSDALNALLETGMPNLEVTALMGAGNANFVNDILSYPNKQLLLLAYSMYIYSVSPNLDPRSTRHIISIVIQTDSFTQADYKNLARLNLDRVDDVSLILKQVSDCEVLKNILKISKKALICEININNQKSELTDSCFADQDIQTYRVKYVQIINANWESKSIYLPKFINSLFATNKQINVFVIPKSYIGDQTLKAILNVTNLNEVVEIVIDQNHLTDDSISQLFKKNLTKLQVLSLQNNQITSKGLQPIIGKTFQHLIDIEISGTFIGDPGIQILAQAEFPNLQKLYISNVDLTLLGLKSVFEMKAPNLNELRILNNNISQQQLVQFFQSEVYMKLQKLNLLQTNIKISFKNMKKIMLILQQKQKNMQIIAQVYHLELANAASLKAK